MHNEDLLALEAPQADSKAAEDILLRAALLCHIERNIQRTDFKRKSGDWRSSSQTRSPGKLR